MHSIPLMGKELDQGKVGWGLNRKGNLADVLSPVGGVIVEVNSRVRENPGMANREPYGDGWLFMVRTPDIKATMNKLMTDQQLRGEIADRRDHDGMAVVRFQAVFWIP